MRICVLLHLAVVDLQFKADKMTFVKVAIIPCCCKSIIKSMRSVWVDLGWCKGGQINKVVIVFRNANILCLYLIEIDVK